MKKNKEKWISEIEDSLDNVTKRIQMDASFKSSIIEKLSQKSKVVSFTKRTTWSIASFILDFDFF